MTSTAPVVIMAGFSLTNRILLYMSPLTGPVAFLSSIETNLPIGVGFLGYTIYQQYLFYIATRDNQLHALSLVPPYLNILYAFAYLCGLSAANRLVCGLMCVGTIAALIINLVTTWVTYQKNLPEGYGAYRFWFLGWRTLSPRWRIFFLYSAVLNTVATATFAGLSIYIAIITPFMAKTRESRRERKWVVGGAWLWGIGFVLIIFWPAIVWMESIYQGNNLVSATDMISVYLFIAQTAPLVITTLFSIAYAVFLERVRRALLIEQAAHQSSVVRLTLAIIEFLY